MEEKNSNASNKIAVKTNKELKIIPISDITYIKYNACISEINLMDANNKIQTSKRLKSFEQELAPCGFVRINHNALANTQCISSFNRKKRCIVFVNNEQCEVSARKVKIINRFFRSKFTVV